MAVGDQIHWQGNSAVDLRPSSGVEVVIKHFNMSYNYTSNYMMGYYRNSVSNPQYNPICGSLYNTSKTGPNSAYNDSYAGTGSFAWAAQQNILINYDEYIYLKEVGTSGYYVQGFITKD